MRLHHFQKKVIDGMLARGYELEFAERIFKQIEGFGEMAFRRVMRRASRCWSTCPAG